jgi:hypothetical protein
MNFDKILDLIINKFHMILAGAAQGSILAYHYHTGHDIGPGVQNTVYAYYGFLGAHALTYQKYPDPTQPQS